MRIETICTGDELLTGLTADTNSSFFQAQLLERVGETVRRSTVVGDLREDIIEALQSAAARSDAVLVSGGLGPTTDDLTAECAAAFAKVPLEEHLPALRHLEERFRARGVALTDNNRRQALVPRGAEVVLNAQGSAPMFALQVGRCLLCFVPGVPREYRHLVETAVIPRLLALKERSGDTRQRALLLLKTVGLPESHLDARVRPLATRHPLITFGFRTHAPENHLKLLAEAATLEEAKAALDAAAVEARALLGKHLFAQGDQTMEGVVVEQLKRRGETVAFAESCTGGLVSSQLTRVPGASDVFPGGLVTYAERLKTQWAGVDPALLKEHGAVSAACAQALADGVRRSAGAHFGVAVTGYAGPGGGDAKAPVGTVFVACSSAQSVVVEQHRFVGDRDRVRNFAAWSALDLLRRALEGQA